MASDLGSELSNMWTNFRHVYLRVLFPAASRRLGLEVADGEGFESCPPQILQVLTRFLIRTVIVPIQTNTSDVPVHEYAAAAIIHVLFQNRASCEIVHEIIRQSLLVPFAYHQTIRLALFLLSSWMFSPHDDRHRFFLARHHGQIAEQASSDELDEQMDIAAAIKYNPDDVVMDKYIHRYINYLRLVFLTRNTSSNDTQEVSNQLPVYRDALDILRALVLEKFHKLETHTWEHLMMTLIEIERILLHQEPLPLAVATNTSSPFVAAIAETVLITWIRSRMLKDSLWIQLRSEMAFNMRLPKYAKVWADLVIKLTLIMASKVYDYDRDVRVVVSAQTSSEKEAARAKTGRRAPMSKPNYKDSAGTKTRQLEKNSQATGSPSTERIRKETLGSSDDSESMINLTMSSRRERDLSMVHKHLKDRVAGNASATSTMSTSDGFSGLADDLSECTVEYHKAHQLSRIFGSLKEIEWWNAENSLWMWKIRPFGPLFGRIVVTKQILGPLVRATAINAYRAALFSNYGKYFVEPHPFSSRRETIGVISSRHKVPSWTFERLADQVFTAGRDAAKQQLTPSSHHGQETGQASAVEPTSARG
eukprot:jgi/Hompol1/5363/HPOL_000408-RA